MAGLTITINDAELQRKLRNLERGLIDPSPLMKVWGEIAHASITENFEVGGRPPWRPLSPATIQRKGHARPLIGRTGNLSRIIVQPGRDFVKIGVSPAARSYAAIHQFGGQAGRNRKVKIPARPYLVLQPEDETEMQQAAIVYVGRLAG